MNLTHATARKIRTGTAPKGLPIKRGPIPDRAEPHQWAWIRDAEGRRRRLMIALDLVRTAEGAHLLMGLWR